MNPLVEQSRRAPVAVGAARAAAVVGGAALLAHLGAERVDGRWLSAGTLLAVVVGTLLLHRRRADPTFDRGMSTTSWRAFTAVGRLLVLGAAADVLLGVLRAPAAWAAVPLAAAIVAGGPLAFHGIVRWNPQGRHVLDRGHALTSLCAALVVVGAGNLLVPHLAAAAGRWDGWRLQVWLVTVAVLVVLTGTAVVTAVVLGLARDVRLWSLAGALAALTVVDASVAVAGDTGVVALRAACTAGVVVAGATVLRVHQPGPAVVGPTVPARWTLVVLGAAVLVLLGAQRGEAPAAFGWGLLAATVSGARLWGVVGQLSELARARAQAHTDDLTGIGNRRSLVARLEELGERGTAAALLKIDLDDFGLVNERLGHRAGDRTLREVAELLRGLTPLPALTVRTAGDTFAVLLPGAGEAEALRLAARLDLALGALPTPTRLGRGLSASIGLATAAAGGLRADDLMHRAAAALAVARTGPSTVARYDAELEGRTRDRNALADDLRAALGDPRRRQDELLLHYQPQVRVSTAAVAGVEALVRWQHPGRGLLSPDRFLDLAEENDLMDGLTAHLLERAAREVSGWALDGAPLRVSVNLSAGSLASRDLLPTVDAVLHRTGLDPTRLVLEITETTLMGDPDLALQVTESLVDRGISLSIDDYGTGYSSLAHLTDLPATELKLDRAFTLRVTAEPRTAAIVEGTIALAHRLGLRVVAEGVEDLEALAVLRDLGADETQGYLHSRPLAPAALEAWLAERAPGPARLPGPRPALPA